MPYIYRGGDDDIVSSCMEMIFTMIVIAVVVIGVIALPIAGIDHFFGTDYLSTFFSWLEGLMS